MTDYITMKPGKITGSLAPLQCPAKEREGIQLSVQMYECMCVSALSGGKEERRGQTFVFQIGPG